MIDALRSLLDPDSLEVARFVAECLRADGTTFVLVSGPQGSGKSTLTRRLADAFTSIGVAADTVSIDDFYLRRTEQVELAQRGNPYLAMRGYPGTHDVALGTTVMSALRRGEVVDVPVYDKGAQGGLGDRSPAVRRVGPLRLLFLEGWMLAYRPCEVVDPWMREPNAALAAYAQWREGADALVVLYVADHEMIVDFRVDAERARRERGEGAMSDADAEAYIRQFLPAYRAYEPALLRDPPIARTLFVQLDAARRVVRRHRAGVE